MPSERAFSGSWWTSTRRPSAPTATAAREKGRTLWRLPVPWRRVDEDGKMAAFFYGGDYGEIESVARKIGEGADAAFAEHDVVVAFGLRMYSAAMRNSSRVADMPRLRRTGSLARPARLRREKFCMLRAPIWMTSAYSSTRSSDSLSMASVTMPKPNCLRTLERIFKPDRPRPWKE